MDTCLTLVFSVRNEGQYLLLCHPVDVTLCISKEVFIKLADVFLTVIACSFSCNLYVDNFIAYE